MNNALNSKLTPCEMGGVLLSNSSYYVNNTINKSIQIKR